MYRPYFGNPATNSTLEQYNELYPWCVVIRRVGDPQSLLINGKSFFDCPTNTQDTQYPYWDPSYHPIYCTNEKSPGVVSHQLVC